MIRFLITGCGRSGTGYISKLLNNLGIVTGHEDVCLPNAWRYAETHYVGDVSCWGVRFIPDLRDANVKIIHLVRNPFHVGRSYSHRRLFHSVPDPSDAYGRAFFDHDPVPWSLSTPEDRFAVWWGRWNQAVELVASARFRVEDLTATRAVRQLAETLTPQRVPEWKICNALTATDPKCNAKPRDEGFSLDVLSPVPRSILHDTAARYGYHLHDRTTS